MTHVAVYLPQDCFNSGRGNDFNVPLSHNSEINPETEVKRETLFVLTWENLKMKKVCIVVLLIGKLMNMCIYYHLSVENTEEIGVHEHNRNGPAYLMQDMRG